MGIIALRNSAFATTNAAFEGIFIITGPAGGPATIPLSMNLHISGFTALTGNSTWSMQIGSILFGQGTLASTGVGTGLLAGLSSGSDVTINSPLATPTVLVGVGQSVPLNLFWIVRAEADSAGATAHLRQPLPSWRANILECSRASFNGPHRRGARSFGIGASCQGQIASATSLNVQATTLVRRGAAGPPMEYGSVEAEPAVWK